MAPLLIGRIEKLRETMEVLCLAALQCPQDNSTLNDIQSEFDAFNNARNDLEPLIIESEGSDEGDQSTIPAQQLMSQQTLSRLADGGSVEASVQKRKVWEGLTPSVKIASLGKKLRTLAFPDKDSWRSESNRHNQLGRLGLYR